MVNAIRFLEAVAFAGLASAASIATNLPSGWVYDGCYTSVNRFCACEYD